MANCDPLRPDELTLSDYLADLDYRTALIGKTHTGLSAAALAMRDANLDDDPLARMACGGFEAYTVHKGLYPDQLVPEQLAYNKFLKQQGCKGGLVG